MVKSISIEAPVKAQPGVTFGIEVILMKDGEPVSYSEDFSWLPTVAVTCTDTGAVLPTNYAFVDGDTGSHALPMTLNTVGNWTITITPTDGSCNPIVIPIAVENKMEFKVEGEHSPPVGMATEYTVTLMRNGVPVTDGSWLPTVQISVAGDSGATVPANYTFVAGDNGVHTFAITFSSEEAIDVHVVDVSNSANAGLLLLNKAASLTGETPVNVTLGTSFDYRLISMMDGAFQPESGLSSPGPSWYPVVTVTSSDTAALLPATYSFTYGDCLAVGHTFSITLNTAGTQTVTFTSPDWYGDGEVSFTVTFHVSGPATKVWVSAVDAGLEVSFKVMVAATDAADDADFGKDGTAVTISTSAPDAADTINGLPLATSGTIFLVKGQALVTLYLKNAGVVTFASSGLTSGTVEVS